MKKQATRYTSMPLTYDIFGSDAFVLQINVTIVRTVVIPSVTRAGAAVRSIQNDTVERITIMEDGM